MKRIDLHVLVLLIFLVGSFFHITSADTNHSGTQIAGVPELAQNPELPTGCEATALTMLLRWAQADVKKTDVAAAFPQLPVPARINGQLVGGNPNVGFVGNPFTANGYGVYHAPVAAVLNHFLPNRAQDFSGGSFDQVIATLDSGRPVVAWITDGLQAPRLDSSWSDGHGGTVHWMVPEHVVIVTGYTASAILAHDPESGQSVTYPRAQFQTRWEQMGRQAVTVKTAQAMASAGENAETALHVSSPMVVKKAWSDVVRETFLRSNNTTLSFYLKIFGVVLTVFYVLMLIFSLIRKLR